MKYAIFSENAFQVTQRFKYFNFPKFMSARISLNQRLDPQWTQLFCSFSFIFCPFVLFYAFLPVILSSGQWTPANLDQALHHVVGKFASKDQKKCVEDLIKCTASVQMVWCAPTVTGNTRHIQKNVWHVFLSRCVGCSFISFSCWDDVNCLWWHSYNNEILKQNNLHIRIILYKWIYSCALHYQLSHNYVIWYSCSSVPIVPTPTPAAKILA